MTLAQFIDYISLYQWHILLFFTVMPLVSYIIGTLYRPRPGHGIIDYIFSVQVYLVSIPGMFSLSLLLYSMLFIRANLLQVNVIIYFVPILGMVASLYVISRRTSLKQLPGFGRIQGLLTMLGLVFLVLFFLSRLNFFIGFFSSLYSLLAIALILFASFKIAARKFLK